MIAAVTALFLAAVTIAWAGRLIIGPTLHDRAAAAHAIALNVCMIIAALAVLDGRPAWIDAALALGIADLVLMVAAMKVFRLRSLQTALVREPAGER
jgi:multisubunit Na+/H+ antiporter MnhF subunit